MACQIAEHKRVLFVLWGKPERRDLEPIADRARALLRKEGPFVFIARVPPGAEPPDETIRKEFSRVMALMFECCSSYHAVIEGTGFGSSAKRAVLTGLFLMSAHRGKLHVHAHIDEVLGAVPLSMRHDLAWAFKDFGSRGLLGIDMDTQVALPPAGAP